MQQTRNPKRLFRLKIRQEVLKNIEKEKISLIKKNLNHKLKAKKEIERVKRKVLEENRMKKLETQYKIKLAKLNFVKKVNDRYEKISHRNVNISRRKPRKRLRKRSKKKSIFQNSKRKLSIESFSHCIYNKNNSVENRSKGKKNFFLIIKKFRKKQKKEEKKKI